MLSIKFKKNCFFSFKRPNKMERIYRAGLAHRPPECGLFNMLITHPVATFRPSNRSSNAILKSEEKKHNVGVTALFIWRHCNTSDGVLHSIAYSEMAEGQLLIPKAYKIWRQAKVALLLAHRLKWLETLTKKYLGTSPWVPKTNINTTQTPSKSVYLCCKSDFHHWKTALLNLSKMECAVASLFSSCSRPCQLSLIR